MGTSLHWPLYFLKYLGVFPHRDYSVKWHGDCVSTFKLILSNLWDNCVLGTQLGSEGSQQTRHPQLSSCSSPSGIWQNYGNSHAQGWTHKTKTKAPGMSWSSCKIYFVSLETHFLVRDTIVREIQCLYDFMRNSKSRCPDSSVRHCEQWGILGASKFPAMNSPLHNPWVKQKSHQKLQLLHLYTWIPLALLENKY